MKLSKALSFRAKLLLAMMLVVAAVTGATLYLAEKSLRANHDALPFVQAVRASDVAHIDPRGWQPGLALLTFDIIGREIRLRDRFHVAAACRCDLYQFMILELEDRAMVGA